MTEEDVAKGWAAPEVSQEGPGSPAGYRRPLAGNGEVSLLVGPHGGMGAGPDGSASPPVFRAGRRHGSQRRFELIPYGFYDVSSSVGGKPLGEACQWGQSIDRARGRVVCRSRHAGGIEVCTTVIAPLGWDALLVRRTLSVAAESPVRVEQRLDYALGADSVAVDPPPGVRLLPSSAGSVGSRLLYEASGQTDFVGCVLLCASGVPPRTPSGNRLSAVVRSRASRGVAAEACWLIAFADACHRPDESATGEAALASAGARAEALARRFLDIGFDGVADESAAAWGRHWTESSVDVPDAAVMKMYRTAQYHLRCNATKWSQPVGLLNSHWAGRYFGWDEMFCHQALLWSGHVDLARRIPEFRHAVLEPARRRVAHYANQDVYGARYPWETLEDGSEGTPPGFWCDHVFHMSNIAVCAWSQYACTADSAYLAQTGFPVLRDCARFFFTHVVYDDGHGGQFVGKTTDLERLGPARDRAFMTTCGVVYTLQAAARAVAALDLPEHRDEARAWLRTAERLVASLPERGGRYIACPGAEQESIAVTGGIFPYPLFGPEEPRQARAVRHFARHGRGSGNMYPVGSHVCAWYAGWMAVALSAIGDAAAALFFLKEASESAGLFGECFEINEGGIQCRPWFSTASGNVVHGLNRMLVDFDGGEVRLAPGVPASWRTFAFALPCGLGRTLEAEVRSGALSRLVVRGADGAAVADARVRVPARLCRGGRPPQGWRCSGRHTGMIVLRQKEEGGGEHGR